MVRILALSFIVLLSIRVSSQSTQNVVSKKAQKWNDSLSVDTIVNQYELLVANVINTKRNSIEECRVWLRFPDSLRFENFRSPKRTSTTKSELPLDLSILKKAGHSQESIQEVRDSLIKKNKAIKGANFNGHYKVLTTEISHDCCFHFIVDVETGKAVEMVSSLWGAEFKKDSYLLLINPVKDIYQFHFYNESYRVGRGYYPASSSYRKPEAYLFLEGKVKRVY